MLLLSTLWERDVHNVGTQISMRLQKELWFDVTLLFLIVSKHAKESSNLKDESKKKKVQEFHFPFVCFKSMLLRLSLAQPTRK